MVKKRGGRKGGREGGREGKNTYPRVRRTTGVSKQAIFLWMFTGGKEEQTKTKKYILLTQTDTDDDDFDDTLTHAEQSREKREKQRFISLLLGST